MASGAASFPPSVGLTWFATAPGSIVPPLLRRFPPVACSVAVPFGSTSLLFVELASPKSVNFGSDGSKA